MLTRKQVGFTLLELLVVVSVIGLIASIALVSFNTARGKAKDARRYEDAKQIQNALELYYDKFGTYPIMTEDECGGTEGYTVVSNNFMQSLVTQGLLATPPVDAGRVNCNLQYATTGDQKGYVIFVHFESRSNFGCNGNAPYWSCIGLNMNPGW